MHTKHTPRVHSTDVMQQGVQRPIIKAITVRASNQRLSKLCHKVQIINSRNKSTIYTWWNEIHRTAVLATMQQTQTIITPVTYQMLHKHHMYYVSDMHILHASHTNIITEQVAVNGHTMYVRTYVCLSSGTSPLVKNTVCCPNCAHKLPLN